MRRFIATHAVLVGMVTKATANSAAPKKTSKDKLHSLRCCFVG